MYHSEQSSSAWGTIHADPAWWKKVLIGGALLLTFVAWPVVEGFQLESIENTQRGYPTPLPRWNDIGGKIVVGLFALVLDFFFFMFPLLITGIILFCSTLIIGLSTGGMTSTIIASVIAIIAGGYLLGVWLLGASPIAKLRYVKDGNLEQTISGSFIRDLARRPLRNTYFRARLRSLPFYFVACTLLIAAGMIGSRNTYAGLFAGWLGASALFYARLVTIQLYDVATKAWERQRFEDRQRSIEYSR